MALASDYRRQITGISLAVSESWKFRVVNGARGPKGSEEFSTYNSKLTNRPKRIWRPIRFIRGLRMASPLYGRSAEEH